MTFMDALRIFNQGKESWCHPRKGTADWDKVKEIQMSGRPPLPSNPKKARKPRASKSSGTSTKSSGTSTASIGVDASTQTAGGRMRAGRPRKIAPDLVMPPPAVAIQPKPRGRPRKVAV